MISPWEHIPTRLQNGYDITNSAGIFEGRYARCGASENVEDAECSCYGCLHDGQIPALEIQIVERRTPKAS